MNQIIQHIPNYCSGFTPEVAEFETVDELLNIPFVKHHEKEGHSFQMSDLNLMIVKDDESWWWVVGTVKFPDRVDLPKWETESMKERRLVKERKQAVNERQRLLKFRIWDAESESFESDSRFVLIDFALKHDGYHFQQYTGLMDKNGVEIYEGDIVKLADLNYKVFWDEWKWNASCPYYHPHHYPQFGDRFFSNARCSEVIGNIYENADLLK
jgi:hypothetical protein